jgi:hypothetical protein
MMRTIGKDFAQNIAFQASTHEKAKECNSKGNGDKPYMEQSDLRMSIARWVARSS